MFNELGLLEFTADQFIDEDNLAGLMLTESAKKTIKTKHVSYNTSDRSDNDLPVQLLQVSNFICGVRGNHFEGGDQI